VIHRIEVGIRPDLDDPRGNEVVEQAQSYLALGLRRVRTRSVYKIVADLLPSEVDSIRCAITDPIIEESSCAALPVDPSDWVIRVGFRPGVTDNVGRTARVFICDLLRRDRDSWREAPTVYTEQLYVVEAPELEQRQVEALAWDLLANRLIQRVAIWRGLDFRSSDLDLDLPLTAVGSTPAAEEVLLPAEDQALLALSRQRTLSLSLLEMRAIREHYSATSTRAYRHELGLPQGPTDAELEVLAQTWSEHCKHKIFNATIQYHEGTETQTINSLFRTFIVGATNDVAHRVSWLVSVFHDNAGVVRLNDSTHLVYKVETHNSPSALDPYGGAMTGIVGVNRDPFGTGVGAELLTNVWGYCFGAPDTAERIPEGLMHPRRIRDGVHRGVIEGGNQSGIPYSRGFEFFDQRFVGKPLVFCGTVGVMPSLLAGASSARKEIHVGDHVVMVGGRIGKDGIHGATFSSEALHRESPTHAVQIGDPITQKMMTDLLLEARDLGLYRTLTDNGAGGLSSSVGELARITGGAELELERAPLKYEGLAAWEILLSEAQERMTLAVPPEKLPALQNLARRRDVELTPLGCFTDSGRFIVRYRGTLVADLALDFLHDGCPKMQLEARWTPPQEIELDQSPLASLSRPFDELLLRILGSDSFCSKEQLCRRYDHEVKGLSVIKPLVGVHRDVPADATVMRVKHGCPEAILLSEGIAPRLGAFDPGLMAAYVVDLAVRRLVASGAKLGQIAGLDNFCWPDPVASDQAPDGEHKLAGLVRACRELKRMVVELNVPLISGKDSMKNDSVRGGVKISIPPTLLFSALAWIDDAKRAIDLRLIEPEQTLYVLGVTEAELGASELVSCVARENKLPELLGVDQALQPVVPARGLRLPRTDVTRSRHVCQALERAIDDGLVQAAHAPHLGGLATACATLCLASGLGLKLDLGAAPRGPDVSDLELLFAESSSRLLIAARAGAEADLERLLADEAVAWARLGRSTTQHILSLSHGPHSLVEVHLDRLRSCFQRTEPRKEQR
jgi:phosphoribosylformylglycinamidine synthase